MTDAPPPPAPDPHPRLRGDRFWLAAQLALLGVAVGAALWWAVRPERPERAYERYARAQDAGEFYVVWEGMDEASRTELEAGMPAVARVMAAKTADPVEVEKLLGLTGVELFAELGRRGWRPMPFTWSWVVGVDRDGDRAVLHMTRDEPDGTVTAGEVLMVREDGAWKASLARP